MILQRVVIGALVASVVCLSALSAEEARQAAALQKSFVWAPSAPTGKQVYAVFRKTLELKGQPQSALLRLFADSRYILWINGNYVDRGPCRFDPKGPEYDTLDVKRFLQPGANAIAILVHHFHDGQTSDVAFAGRFVRHAPGLTATLELTDSNGATQTIATDATWLASTRHRFDPSPLTKEAWDADWPAVGPRSTGPKHSWSSIVDRIDARRDSGDWTVAAFDDAAWQAAVPIDGHQWGPLRARHIPLLRETEVGPLTVVQWSKKKLDGEPKLKDLLPLEIKAGEYLVLDVGQFVQAYSVLDFEADEGSRLALEYAQSFRDTDGLNKSISWGHVNQYTAKAGRQTYMSTDTFGCKYVVVQVVGGRVQLLGMKMVNRLYPFDVVGKFASSDPLLNGIWRMGVRTIQVCSEDAYVDCATRERVEWLGDAVMVSYPISRLTMAGPAADGKPYWSDPRLFGSGLRHMGQSLQPDGRIKARHPSTGVDIHSYIEDYCCLWIQAIRSWHDNTGDLELVREVWPAVTAQLKWFLDRRTEHGLVKAREFVFPGNPLCYQVCEGATLNAFLVRALADAAELARLLGQPEQQRQYAEASQAIQKAINAHLWDQQAGTYHGGIKDGTKTPPTVHAAGICLYFDVVPPERRKSVEQWFLANMDREACEPFQFAYYHEVLARIDSDAADLKALDVIRKRWAPMSRFETGTTWEGFGPAENCHDMGSTPTLYLSRHVLGVQVDGPVANRRLTIEPRLGDLKRVEGVVVTEFGPVPVCWDRSGENGRFTFEIEIPTGVTARVSVPRPAGNAELTIDDKAVKLSGGLSYRFVAIELGEGQHRGEAR